MNIEKLKSVDHIISKIMQERGLDYLDALMYFEEYGYPMGDLD